MRIFYAIVCGALALLAVIYAVAEAFAREESVIGLERAASLERVVAGASNAEHFEQLALVRPDDAPAMLRAALEADPRRTSARIDLGLALERRGDFRAAEQNLLEAARWDQQFLPAWTLTNFYFRRGHKPGFWQWASRAAALAYDDFRPLLRLTDSMEPNPAIALDRLGSFPALERAYLDFLIRVPSLDRAELVARRMMARRDPADEPRLADFVTREIRARRAGHALSIWNSLFIPLDADRGPVLTNGDFRMRPTGIGFDWSVPTTKGVSARWDERSMSFELSGAQADRVVLLEQFIPVTKGKEYRLVFEFRFTPEGETPDVMWEMNDSPMGRSIAAANTGLVPLRLICRRRPGTVPVQGILTIQDVRVEVF